MDEVLPAPTNLIRRITDISSESHTMRISIRGYEDMPLVSIEEAVKPLVPFVRDVERKAHNAKQRRPSTQNYLSPDESVSTTLYTKEWKPHDDSLYFILNRNLRTDDRQQLKAWFLYLKLIITALSRLPPTINRTIYRGVRLDLSYLYPLGKTFVWWGFSSCTTNISILQNEHFFGKNHPRTLFNIDSQSGRDIHCYSYTPMETEVLLLAGTQFTVIGHLDQGSDLHIIPLKEVGSFLKPLFDHHAQDHAMSVSRSSMKLKKLIAKCESHSLIDLERQSLKDQHIPVVIEQALVERRCTTLRLSNNRIKSVGVSILADALDNNTTLRELHLYGNYLADRGVLSLASVLSRLKC